MLTQEKRFQPILTRREDKIQKYKVKVQAVACKNPRICVVILSENVIWRSDEACICIRQRFLLSIWSFTLFSNYRLRFSARAMNRRQIVSRCGDVQKNACMSREFFESGTFTIGWAGDMYTKAIYTFIWSFTLLSNRHLRFSARVMNRRQIVSRCGGVQKRVGWVVNSSSDLPIFYEVTQCSE